jgi:DNA-formamidopyrimidine glycosylase
MPEVVEVCLTSMFLHNKLKGKKITDIIIHGGRYKRNNMFKNMENIKSFKKLLPLKISKIDSKGKFMWFNLNNSYYLMNTFGLSGGWGFTKKTHSNIEFKINNNKSLYFTDSRNFGTIKITNNICELDKKLNKLAPDLLKTDFTENEFYKRVYDLINNNKNNKNKTIIKVLMSQNYPTSLGCGLGNYLAAEVLYMAKISPHTKMINIYNDKKLSDSLSKSIKYITKLSFLTTDVETDYLEDMDYEMCKYIKKIRNNSKYNFHPSVKIYKQKFKFKVYRQKFDPFGNKVKRDKIIDNRTTYWVPDVQK